MELAALFWGGVFTLLFILSWGSVFLARRALLRRHPDPLEGLEALPEPKAPGVPVEGHYYFQLPALFLPALQFTLVLDLPATSRRRLGVQWPLMPGKNQGKWHWTGRRGLYTGPGADLKIQDFWGFCRATVGWIAPLQVKILPAPFQGEYQEPLPSGTGDQASRSPRWERNSELLEVRKYYPGDDFRRINWKVYAHAGELFLRIGEENPPPEAQIGLLLDLGATGLNLSGDLEDSFLDARIAHLGAAARSLSDRGFGVVILLPGQSRPLLWGSPEVPEALAALRCAAPPGELPIPSHPLNPLLVFTHPLSAEREPLVQKLESTGIRVFTETLPWPWIPEPPVPWYQREPKEARQRRKDREKLRVAFQAREGSR